MVIKILINPNSFVKEANKQNITLELLKEAIECIGQQKTCKMFSGKSNRGEEGCISSATLQNWLATFEYTIKNPDKEDSNKCTGARFITKKDDSWDDFVRIVKTPIPDDIISHWSNLSKKNLGDQAIKYGLTLGIRNSKALILLPEKMKKMVDRRKELFWYKNDEEEPEDPEVEEKVNYSHMNVPTLHKLCKERNIVSHDQKKDGMIKLLEEYDKNINNINIYTDIQYETLTNDKLKNLCKIHGLTSYNKLNKENLIKKLKEYDESILYVRKEMLNEKEDEEKEDEDKKQEEKDGKEANKNILETFKFDSKIVRTTGTYENPWFVVKDVCEILGLNNATKSIINIPSKWKDITEIQSLGGTQLTNIINEAGLYKLIMRSNKPNAEKFQEWVCEDVLPSIRKRGTYTLEDKYKFILKEGNPLKEVINRTDLDKEAELLEKEYDWHNYTNHCVIYIAYIGKGLVKLGYSDCGMKQREKKHMSSSETEFEQFRVISSFKISNSKMETMVKNFLLQHNVEFNKQKEIYKPPQTLKHFIEIIGQLLLDNDLKYQLDLARKEIIELKLNNKELEMKLR